MARKSDHVQKKKILLTPNANGIVPDSPDDYVSYILDCFAIYY